MKKLKYEIYCNNDNYKVVSEIFRGYTRNNWIDKIKHQNNFVATYIYPNFYDVHFIVGKKCKKLALEQVVRLEELGMIYVVERPK